MEFNLTTWAGISVAILAVVGAVKKAFPAWTKGKEPMLAIAIGVTFSVTAKLTGAMDFGTGGQGWIQCVLGGLTTGVGAGIGHDYVVNPVVAAKSAKG